LAFFFCAYLAQGQVFREGIGFRDAANLAVAASAELHNEAAVRAIRQGAWLLGRRAYFPKLTLQASEDERLSWYQADSFQKNYSVNVDQLLFDGGRLASSRRLERAELELGASRLETMSGEVGESAVNAYRSILTNRALMEIRKAGLTALKGQRAVLHKEVELGLALQSDLDGADISIAEAEIEIMSLEMEMAEMDEQFLVLLGMEKMPELTEKIDVWRSAALPDKNRAVSIALERNQELKAAALSIRQKKEEARFAALSWVPTLRATGSFSVAGNQYPLTKYTWSAGLSVEFAKPWFSSNTSATAGFQGRKDKTARVSGTFVPVPDPASSLGVKQAKLALAYEQQKYTQALEQTARTVKMAIEKCMFADTRRRLALETSRIAKNKLELFKIKRRLGQITSLELMEAQTECTQKEIALVQAATALLAGERELEQLLDLQPGELKNL
jgi:outer membrane protein TolC